MHKGLFLAAAWLFLAHVVPAQQTVIHDPNAEVRSVGPFSAIRVSDAIDLYLTQANEEAVAVSAGDANYLSNIKVAVTNGELRIWYAKDGLNLSGGRKLRAYVSCRSIQALSASGASDVLVQGVIKGDDLAIHLSGSSDFRGEIDLASLQLEQSGSSDITISGHTGELNLTASGASDCKGYGLTTDHCSVRASGASDIYITVNKTLKATASGASSVYYRGTGTVTDVRAEGSSTITRKR